MDIESTWKNSDSADDDLNNLFEHERLQKIRSKLPLKKMRTNLLIGLAYAFVITAGYIALAFYITLWQVLIALAVMIAFNTWLAIETWRLYKNTSNFISPELSLKAEIVRHYNSFMNWCKIQQRVGVFVYPVAAAGGFVYGGHIGSGKTIEEFLYNPHMVIILAITLAILVPACYYLARLMMKVAYGKHLNKLKEFIDELE